MLDVDTQLYEKYCNGNNYIWCLKNGKGVPQWYLICNLEKIFGNNEKILLYHW